MFVSKNSNAISSIVERSGTGITGSGTVEKAGTGIRGTAETTVEKAGTGIYRFGWVMAAICLLMSIQAAAQNSGDWRVSVTEQGDSIAVLLHSEGTVLAGTAAGKNGYYRIPVVALSADTSRSAGSGTGSQSAGSGTGSHSAGSGTGSHSAGSGTGSRSAGSGTGSHSAGSGTGSHSMDNVWGVVELAIAKHGQADLILYRLTEKGAEEFLLLGGVGVQSAGSGTG